MPAVDSRIFLLSLTDILIQIYQVNIHKISGKIIHRYIGNFLNLLLKYMKIDDRNILTMNEVYNIAENIQKFLLKNPEIRKNWYHFFL